MITYEYIASTTKSTLDKMKQVVMLQHELDTYHQNLFDKDPVLSKMHTSFIEKNFNATKAATEWVNKRRGDLILANDEDKVVGVCHFVPNLPVPQTVIISDICVDKTYRGQGIATELMNRVRDWAKGKFKYVVLGVVTNNVNAKKLYYKLGYKDALEVSFAVPNKINTKATVEVLSAQAHKLYFDKYCHRFLKDTIWEELGCTINEMSNKVNNNWKNAKVYRITNGDSIYHVLGFPMFIGYVFDKTNKADMDVITSAMMNRYKLDTISMYADNKNDIKKYKDYGYQEYARTMILPLQEEM